jgi:hypothetical protein
MISVFLYLRKASLYCSVCDFAAAKASAERAITLYESSLGHFRMGCIKYCLHQYSGGDGFPSDCGAA